MFNKEKVNQNNEFTRWQKALFINTTDNSLQFAHLNPQFVEPYICFICNYMWDITCICLTVVYTCTYTYTVDITVCRHNKLTQTI